MNYTRLFGRALLRISGAEAISFLQGLITQDARKLEAGQPVYAALLTPQGKYLHDFFLYPVGGAFVLDGEKARINDLKSRLMLYKLRSDVVIENLPDEGIIALWGEGEPAGHDAIFKDPRLPELGWRMIGDESWCKEQGYQQASEEEYDVLRITLGVPDGSRDMIPEKSLMLECGMDQLNAVSFDKGCYVGQEVTARSKFRGQVRKMLYCVAAEQGTLPKAGTDIMLGDKNAGTMCSHRGGVGLAMLRTEMVQKSHDENTPLTTENCRLSARNPGWFTGQESQANQQG